MIYKNSTNCLLIASLLAGTWFASACHAQQADKGESQRDAVPDAPVSQQNDASAPAPQTSRILGVMPNFRSVSADQKLPPQTVKDKFMSATHDSFDYSSIVVPAVLAGYQLARQSTPEFHQGGLGYARYLWHAALDQTNENYMVEFIFPAITHEDNRYYTLGRGRFLHRTGYAISRVVVTRSDAGRSTFNISEVVGSGAASGISTLYYPSQERSFGNTTSAWGTNLGVDALGFMLREFWPDINRWMTRNKGSKP